MFLFGALISAPIFSLSSCWGNKNIPIVNLNKIDFDTVSFENTFYISSSTPDKIPSQELLSSVASSISLKEWIYHTIILFFPYANGKISLDDFDISIDTDLENLEFNFVSPTPFNYPITIFSLSNKISGQSIINSQKITIQSLPNTFKLNPSEFHVNPFEVSDTIYLSSLSPDNKIDLVSKILDSNVTETNNTVLKNVESSINSFFITQLNNQFPNLNYSKFNCNCHNEISINYSPLFNILDSKILHSNTEPFSASLECKFNSNIFDISSQNLFNFTINGIKVCVNSFDLQNLSYQYNEIIDIPVTNVDYQHECIYADTIREHIISTISFSVNKMMESLSILNLSTDDYFIDTSNIKNYENFQIDTENSVDISIKSNSRIDNNPLINSYFFPIKFRFVDQRNHLNSQKVATSIKNLISSKTIKIGDVNDPTNVTINELTNEITKNTSLKSLLVESINSSFSVSNITDTDFYIDFYDSSSKFSVKPGDYSEGSCGEIGKPVYFVVSSSPYSHLLANSTNDASIVDPIEINVVVDNSEFDLNTIGEQTFFSQSSPQIISVPNPKSVSSTQLSNLIDKQTGPLFKSVLQKINEYSPAVNSSDFNIVIPDSTYDASSSITVPFVVSASTDTKILKNSIQFLFWLKSSQETEDISEITFSYSEEISVPTFDLNYVTASEIDNVIIQNKTVFNKICDEVSKKIVGETFVGSVEYGVDYEIVSNLSSDSFKLSDQSPTSLPCLKVISKGTNKIKGEFLINLSLKGSQIYDTMIEYQSSIWPDSDTKTNDGKTLTDEHTFAAGWVGHCRYKLDIDSINISFKFSRNKLRQYVDSLPNDKKNEAHPLSFWLDAEHNIIDTSSILGWITGDYFCLAYAESRIIDFENDLPKKTYTPDQHYEVSRKPNKVELGFYSGNHRDPDKNDALFDAFSFFPEKNENDDNYHLCYGWNSSRTSLCPNSLRWGCRGINNIYKKSNNGCTSIPFSKTKYEYWK